MRRLRNLQHIMNRYILVNLPKSNPFGHGKKIEVHDRYKKYIDHGTICNNCYQYAR